MAPDTQITPATKADGTSTNIVKLPHAVPPQTPSEKVIDFVKEHPLVTVAGGLVVGLAISALIPRSRQGRKLSNRALRLAEASAASALSFGRDALDRAEDGGAIARKRAGVFAQKAEKITGRAAARAEKASEKAIARAEKLGIATLGKANVLGHAAADRVERISHIAAERAEDFGGRASDRLGRLGDKALAQSSKLFGVPESRTTLADRILDKLDDAKARIRR